MCINFICKACKTPSKQHCPLANTNQIEPKCTITTIDPDLPDVQKRCWPCKTIDGAIVGLNQLVFQQPWLLTEGVMGADTNRADWELDQDTTVSETYVDWDHNDDELWTRLKRMGLEDMRGMEKLNDGHGIAMNMRKQEPQESDLGTASGTEMQASVFESEEGTLTTDETDGRVEHDMKVEDEVFSGKDEANKKQDDFVGIGGLFA